MHKRFDGVIHPSLIFLLSSFLAQGITLSIEYPLDLIKWRLQTRNKRYKYKGIYDALWKEITQNGFMSLYKGAIPFTATHIIGTCIQFTVYESIIKHFKDQNLLKFQEKEAFYVVFASISAGMAWSLICNGPEALVALKQAEPEHKIHHLILKERASLLTRGLGINMYYQSLHSAMFFLTVTYVGKIFNVELED